MAEAPSGPQPTPEATPPPVSKPESSAAPQVEAGSPATNPAGQENQNAGSAAAENLQNTVDSAKTPQDIEDTVKNFANELNQGDNLVDTMQKEQGAAQTTPEGTNPAVENPNPPESGSEQPGDQPPAQENQNLDAQQDQINDMMNKTPEELKALADGGNEAAKKALSDMEKQVSQGAEDMLKQQADTAPQTNQTAEQAQPTAPQAPEQTPPAPQTGEQATAEQVKKDWKDWEGQAQYKEPSADERAQGATVEATNNSAPPPEATPATVNAEAEQIAQEVADTENKADSELTPEQQATKRLAENVKELADLGTDFKSVLDTIAENPAYVEDVKTVLEAANVNANIAGPEGAAAAANAMADSLDDKMAQAEKDGDENEKKRLGFLKTLLKALGVALLAATAAAAAVVAAPSVATIAGTKMAAKAGQR